MKIIKQTKLDFESDKSINEIIMYTGRYHCYYTQLRLSYQLYQNKIRIDNFYTRKPHVLLFTNRHSLFNYQLL